MTEPRTRTAAEVADHAAGLHDDILQAVHLSAVPPGHRLLAVGSTLHPLTLLERLAAQVEDLAAVVAQYEWSDAAAEATEPTPDPADALVDAWEAWFTAAPTYSSPWDETLAQVARYWQTPNGSCNWPYALNGRNYRGRALPPVPPQDVIDAATERILARIEQENAPEEPPPFPPVELPITLRCTVDDTDSIRLLRCGGSLSLQLNITDGSATGPFAHSVVLDDNDARLLAHTILAELGDDDA